MTSGKRGRAKGNVVDMNEWTVSRHRPPAYHVDHTDYVEDYAKDEPDPRTYDELFSVLLQAASSDLGPVERDSIAEAAYAVLQRSGAMEVMVLLRMSILKRVTNRQKRQMRSASVRMRDSHLHKSLPGYDTDSPDGGAE